MIDNFTVLNLLLKRRNVTIDQNVSIVHRLTVFILIGCSIIVTSKQYVGEPINCFTVKNFVPNSVMNSHCWVQSTFSLPDTDKKLGNIYPGVGPYDTENGKEEIKYHNYYQWVPLVLFLQAIFFYIPRYLWKSWEGDVVEAMVNGLQCTDIMKDHRGKVTKLIDYFIKHMKKRRQYAMSFLFCELLAFINVLAQIYLMDLFLSKEFSTYGIEVLAFIWKDKYQRVDPMIRVFPLRTKCTYLLYGFTGSIQVQDGVCVLPINAFNQKVYAFLWFWLVIVAGLTAISLIYQLAKFIPYIQYNLLFIGTRNTKRSHLKFIISQCYFSDWFLLNLLKKNMHAKAYSLFIAGLTKKLKEYKKTDNTLIENP